VFCDGGGSDDRIGNRCETVPQSGDGCGATTIDLLTGGFPCQPFSTAGKRKGTEDDRFLWPEMLRVIREVKPRWIIGENVPGIIEMALGQVVADLEGLGYEVQCVIIPACAVNAPHKRDRVWIVAHRQGGDAQDAECCGDGRWNDGIERGGRCTLQTERPDCRPSSDSSGEGLEGGEQSRTSASRGEAESYGANLECPSGRAFPDWSRDWREVAFESCVRGVDDGLPRRVVRLPDGSEISESKWRQESLKCFGNAIVPQVAMEIMRGIKEVEEQPIELREWNDPS
jgi:DNA (cytosine-5)-methyltransferase 1